MPILLVAMLTLGATAREGDPIPEQYRTDAIDCLLKPALSKGRGAGVGRSCQRKQPAVLDAVPEEKRRPVDNFAFGNISLLHPPLMLPVAEYGSGATNSATNQKLDSHKSMYFQ